MLDRRGARLNCIGVAMTRSLPGRNEQDCAATKCITQKQESHFSIALVLDRIRHRRRVRAP